MIRLVCRKHLSYHYARRQRSKYPQPSVNGLETGHNTPKLETLIRICTATDHLDNEESGHGHRQAQAGYQVALGKGQGLMENEKLLSTDDIRARLEKGESAPLSQEWNDSSASEDRIHIDHDIMEKYRSRFQFADAAAVSASQLSEFVSKEKQISRDGLIRMFISLGYDLKTVNKYLLHLNGEALYVRKRRDYLIAESISKGLSLMETEEILINEGEHSLFPKR